MAKTAAPESIHTPTHDEIAAQAYEIYLREGCAPGRDLEHWLQAETELRNRDESANGSGHTNDRSPSLQRVLEPATTEGVMASVATTQGIRASTSKRGSRR